MYVFPIPISLPTSLSTWSLWVLPVPQAQAVVSCIQPGLVICFTLDNIHVSMLFSRNIPPSPSPTGSKSLFCTSVSLFLFFIEGYHYHLSSLVFLDYINPFNICCKTGLVVLNSPNFCLSEKLFISTSILNEILAGYHNLGCGFFPFSTLNISCCSLLACRVSSERSAVQRMGFPWHVTCCFFLAAFNILSSCLVFVNLNSMCLGVFLLGFILYGTLCVSWTWLTVFFSMLGKISTIISSKIFSYTFFSLLLGPL